MFDLKDKEIRCIMRKIEAIYRTMNWDNETYQKLFEGKKERLTKEIKDFYFYKEKIRS